MGVTAQSVERKLRIQIFEKYFSTNPAPKTA
jgi:hypothetical protein